MIIYKLKRSIALGFIIEKYFFLIKNNIITLPPKRIPTKRSNLQIRLIFFGFIHYYLSCLGIHILCLMSNMYCYVKKKKNHNEKEV